MLGVGIIAPLLPLYAENMGATGIWIGIIFAGFSISRAILSPIFGELSDRRGRKAFISIGLLSYAVISLGYPWAHQLYQLTAVRLLHGAAGGMVIPIAQAYVGDLSPEGEEGRWMGYFNAALFAGFGFGPLVGGALTEVFSMGIAFYVMGVLNFVAFLLSILFLPEIAGKAGRATDGQNSVKDLLARPTPQGLFSFRLMFAAGKGMFFSFLPMLSASLLGLGHGKIGALLGANILFMSLLHPFSGEIADRLNRKWLVVSGGILDSLSLALIPKMGSFRDLLLLVVVSGIGGALSTAAASALTIDEGRKYGMGVTLGAFAMAMGLGIAAGPILGGAVMDLVDVDSVFYFGAGLGMLGVLSFAWLARA